MKKLFNKRANDSQPEPSGQEQNDTAGASAAQSAVKKRGGFLRRSSVSADHNGPVQSQQQQQRSRQRESQYHAPLRYMSARESVVQTIGYLCASGNDDWDRVLLLCDEVSSSEDMAKEAAKALRKEIELGQPESQRRAARLCVIMMRNATDRFRLQIANKKYLDVLEKTIKSSKTTAETKTMLLKALSVLAYENRNDRDLSSLTNLYNKVKAPTDPIGGSSQDAEDPVFDPQIDSQRSARHRSGHEQINLAKEAQMAKSSANMLTEALSFTKPDDLDDNDLIKEFYANCQHAQSIFVDALPWVTAQAEQAARAKRESNEPGENERRPEIDPPASVAPSTTPTQEEKLLHDMLEANTELQAAFTMYDDVHRRKQQTDNERTATERSLTEQKMSSMNLSDGNLINGFDPEPNQSYLSAPANLTASSSRSSSPGSSNIALPVLQPTQAWNQSYGLPAGAASPPSRPNEDLSLQTSSSQKERLPNESGTVSRNPYAAMMNATSNVDPSSEAPASPLSSSLNSRNPFAKAMQSPPRNTNSLSDDTHDFPQAESPLSETNDIFTTSKGKDKEREPDRNPFHRSSGGPLSINSRHRQVSNGSSISTPIEPSEKALGKIRRLSHMQDDSIEESERLQQQQEALEAALRQKYADNAGRAR